jgi:heavy metal sensor kinase
MSLRRFSAFFRPKSLRTRVSLSVAMLLLLAVMLLSVFVYADLGGGLRRTLDDSLRMSASVAAAAVQVSDHRLSVQQNLPGDNRELQTLWNEGTTVRYLDTDGRTLSGFGLGWNAPADPLNLAEIRAEGHAFTEWTDRASDKDFRVYTQAIRENGTVVGFVQVMRDLHPIADTLAELLAALAIGGVLVVVAGGIGGFFLSRQALKPIEKITRTAQEISAQDLSARLNMSHSYDEVGRLASTFDSMLERLEDSFARERRFTADASHELRTPLAAMEAILSVIRAEPRSTEEYQQALDDLAEETTRLRKLAEDLLFLARGEQPGSEKAEIVDLSVLVQDVVEALALLAQEKALSIECQAEPGVKVRGETDKLIRVLLNLIENAVKFTDEGGLTVTVRSVRDTAVVEVIDTGIGIPSDHLTHIFERFYRVDSSRSRPGAGLGLSLARQIVLDHGGDLTVQSTEGHGSTFTVILPRSM